MEQIFTVTVESKPQFADSGLYAQDIADAIYGMAKERHSTRCVHVEEKDNEDNDAYAYDRP